MGNKCVPEEDMYVDAMPHEEEKFEFVPEENVIEDIKSIYDIGKELGCGASCTVFMAKMKETGEKYAIKEMLRDDEFNPKSFRQEVDFLVTLKDHPNILQYYACYMTPTHFYISTKLCTGGALFERIRKLTHFSEKKAAALLKSVIETIQFCHSKNIVHRDLKPENIVYANESDDSNLVLIDFGDAARVEDHEIYTEFVGTIFYLPPEISRHRHGWEMKKSDMWTIGVIAYVLVTGKPPFFGGDNKAIVDKIRRGQFSWPSKIKLSSTCKSFIKSLLMLDCHKRASPELALQHPFLSGRASDENLGDQYFEHVGDFYSGNVLKKILVNNMIVGMDREEKKILVRAFKAIDTDGSGYIEKPEIVAYLKRSGKSPEEADYTAQQMMSVMDPKDTGRISLQDFVRSKTVAKLEQNEDDFLRQTYRSLSKDDEFVKADTLRDWLKQNDKRLQDDKVEEILQKVDEDGNGIIEYEEFKSALKSLDDISAA
eukprot:CAMPEP_0202701572 /NCGR_PEP_ID=MMETSP1385-20130828/14648_1 /ASSEMBLY_ACC=CAM_ASM_000861 /TAXON_ID=933848 /ORGANISM="Elphidium margaritaceum" /LENGTH=484 /DNA_ID=CAMNT_0049359023 /DNA_START=15 /DNA_END=1469 /DNA_ORIENTATION=-